jgi:hypothetical protein
VSAKAFRILHYTPDPASGARFPVGALTVSDSGVEVFLSPHVPSDSCLRGLGRARFFQRLQQRLAKARDFNSIPGLGPYGELSAPVELQPDAGKDFVRQMVAGW